MQTMSRKIDLNREIIDARRQHEEKQKTVEDTLQIVTEKTIDFLEPGESLHELFKKQIHLEEVHGEVNRVEEKIYYTLSRDHGNILESEEDIKTRDLPPIIARLLSKHDLQKEEKRYIFVRVVNNYLGHGILQPLWNDRQVTEIITNGQNEIFAEIEGELKRCGKDGVIYKDLAFETLNEYESYIQTLFNQTGRSIDRTKCAQTGELYDGSRITVNWYPIVRYPTINVRKPTSSTKRFSAKSYVETRAASEDMMEFLAVATSGKLNMVISGATGTGKTVVLRIEIEENTTKDRVVYLEDSRELNPIHPQFVSLQTVEDREENPLDYAALLKQTLRMRPDRIGIQEIRGGNEAAAILKAIMAAHNGVITTAHSSSPEDFDSLMMLWLKESGFNVDDNQLKKMIHNALDVLVFTQRLENGKRRMTEIWEVLPWTGDSSNEFRKLFEYDYETDTHKQVGVVSPKLINKCRKYQKQIPEKFRKMANVE